MEVVIIIVSTVATMILWFAGLLIFAAGVQLVIEGVVRLKGYRLQVAYLDSMLEDVKLIVYSADDWSDGETFYKDAFERIKDRLGIPEDDV